MAKVKGPLLSMRASGSIGKTDVFASWRGIPYVRLHVIPSNPRSTEQLLTRNVFTWLNDVYRHFGAGQSQPWDIAATGRPLTARNMFIKSNMPVLREEVDLANYIASPGALGGPALATFSAVTGVGAGEIDVASTFGTLPTGWAVIVANFFAILDQDPHDANENNSGVASFAFPGPYATTIAGLSPASDYIVSGWALYSRPDGSVAVAPSSSAAATSHA
ncbi:MAG: hypothetical protein WAP47_09580 [Candidatus Rokuibacteriota bacterium]